MKRFLICDPSGKILLECNTLLGASLHVAPGRIPVISERSIYDKRLGIVEMYRANADFLTLKRNSEIIDLGY